MATGIGPTSTLKVFFGRSTVAVTGPGFSAFSWTGSQTCTCRHSHRVVDPSRFWARQVRTSAGAATRIRIGFGVYAVPGSFSDPSSADSGFTAGFADQVVSG